MRHILNPQRWVKFTRFLSSNDGCICSGPSLHGDIGFQVIMIFRPDHDEQPSRFVSTVTSDNLFPMLKVGETHNGEACFWLVRIMSADHRPALASCTCSQVA